MGKSGLRALSAFVLIIAMVGGAAVPGAARGIVPGPGGDAPILRHGVESIAPEDEDLEQLLARDAAFIDGRTAGDNPLSVAQAGKLRGDAAKAPLCQHGTRSFHQQQPGRDLATLGHQGEMAAPLCPRHHGEGR